MSKWHTYCQKLDSENQRVQNGLSALTLDEIAKELNMSKTNLKRANMASFSLDEIAKELNMSKRWQRNLSYGCKNFQL